MSHHVDLSKLSKVYSTPKGPAVIVKDFNLRIAKGEFVTLIGHSGCGKSTLLSMVAGFVRPSRGRVTVDGVEITAPSADRGIVFQDYALFPHLDVAANVGFGLRRLARREREARVAEMLDLVGLSAFARRAPHELSGGQQQRVALARALAPQPQLLLIDEPFSNLDVELRERLAHEVRTILKAANATALLVTHDQLEAFAIGDTIGVMHEGKLHQWDEAYTLYHRPATRFVADFIGHGVFAPATLQEAGEARWWWTRRWARSPTWPNARCPAPSTPASAMCCCAPTTSCTTTTRR